MAVIGYDDARMVWGGSRAPSDADKAAARELEGRVAAIRCMVRDEATRYSTFLWARYFAKRPNINRMRLFMSLMGDALADNIITDTEMLDVFDSDLSEAASRFDGSGHYFELSR